MMKRHLFAALLLIVTAVPHAAAQGPGAQPERIVRLKIRIRKGMLLVPATVNDQPFTFVLDSGGGNTFLLDTTLPAQLHLQPTGTATSFGAGENPTPIPAVGNLKISFAGKDWPAARAGVVDFSAASHYVDDHIDGMLGRAAFADAAITIDYCAEQLTIDRSQATPPPQTALSLPIKFWEGHFVTQARIEFSAGRVIEGMFVLDTGAGPVAVAVTRKQAQAAGLTGSALGHDELPAIGGPFHAALMTGTLRIGSKKFSGITVHVSENTIGALADAEYVGAIGGQFFRNFRTIFDVPNQRLLLIPQPSCAAAAGRKSETRDETSIGAHPREKRMATRTAISPLEGVVR
jgi:predicted aspartyl protease